MFSPIGIAYRKDLVKTPPRSWKDLWDNPEIKGKVGLYEITNTAGFMFLMMTSKIYGSGPMDFDAGFRQIERLKPFPEAGLAGAFVLALATIHLWRAVHSELRPRKCVFCGESVAADEHPHHLEICGLKTLSLRGGERRRTDVQARRATSAPL